MQSFQVTQRTLAEHLRDPSRNPAPEGIEERRLKIYRELVYNNIQGFIEGGFPILRSITPDECWHQMVREFIAQHPSESPYFLDIGQEFLTYLQNHRVDRAGDPPFLLELAHYEWVELALDISDEPWPEEAADGDLLAQHPVVSPLVWCLSYRFPVHQIGVDYQPNQAPDQATFLVVYRNRDDRVKFMESNAVTHRVLQLLQGEEQATGRAVLLQVAQELQAPDPEAIVAMGADLLNQLLQRDILCGVC